MVEKPNVQVLAELCCGKEMSLCRIFDQDEYPVKREWTLRQFHKSQPCMRKAGQRQRPELSQKPWQPHGPFQGQLISHDRNTEIAKEELKDKHFKKNSYILYVAGEAAGRGLKALPETPLAGLEEHLVSMMVQGPRCGSWVGLCVPQG